MATVVAIAYPDEDTAEQARATVWQLEEELIIQADQLAVISRALDKAVEKGLVDFADVVSSPATTTAGCILFWATGRSDLRRPSGAMAGGLIGRDLVANSGPARQSR